MNELLPMITERDGIPVTTSRAVAEQFGKQHKNVIQAIEGLRATLDETEDGNAFNRLNFQPVTLPDGKGEKRPAYLLTRDGFTLLAMGFTGAKAVQFKVAYINAFNRMERLIRGGGVSAPAPALKSIERRLEALEQATEAQTADLSEVGATFLQAIRAAIESGEYYISRPYSKTAETGKQLGRRERVMNAVPIQPEEREKVSRLDRVIYAVRGAYIFGYMSAVDTLNDAMRAFVADFIGGGTTK